MFRCIALVVFVVLSTEARCAENDASRAKQEFSQGQARRAESDWNGAITHFSESIRLHPTADAYCERGVAHVQLRDYNKALADLNEAVRLNPGSHKAHHNRGVTLASKWDGPGAIEAYSQAIRLQPTSAGSYVNRAQAKWYILKDFDAAIKDFDDAVRLAPQVGRVLYYRGCVILEKATGTDTDRWDKDLDAKQIALKRPELERALKDFSAAIRLAPDDPRAYKQRKRIFSLLGETKKANADMSKFKELKGDEPPKKVHGNWAEEPAGGEPLKSIPGKRDSNGPAKEPCCHRELTHDDDLKCG